MQIVEFCANVLYISPLNGVKRVIRDCANSSSLSYTRIQSADRESEVTFKCLAKGGVYGHLFLQVLTALLIFDANSSERVVGTALTRRKGAILWLINSKPSVFCKLLIIFYIAIKCLFNTKLHEINFYLLYYNILIELKIFNFLFNNTKLSILSNKHMI